MHSQTGGGGGGRLTLGSEGLELERIERKQLRPTEIGGTAAHAVFAGMLLNVRKW